MKTSILLIAIALISGTIQSQKKIKGNGKMTTVTRTTPDYNQINCAGSFDFILVAGNEGTIKIDGEENLLEYIVTEVKNGNLIVKSKNRINLRSSNNKTIKITIPFKDIDNVSLAGSGNLRNEDKIMATNFNVSLAGSGKLALHIESSYTKASLAGSGDITLRGSANDLVANISGSGDFHGFDLLTNNTNVSVSGSGDADVYCKESLKARIAGSGNIKYKGQPKIEDTKVAGSGKIESN